MSRASREAVADPAERSIVIAVREALAAIFDLAGKAMNQRLLDASIRRLKRRGAACRFIVGMVGDPLGGRRRMTPLITTKANHRRRCAAASDGSSPAGSAARGIDRPGTKKGDRCGRRSPFL